MYGKSPEMQFPYNRVPHDLFIKGDSDEVCHWLSFYVTETRTCKGELYPPKSLYQLLTGLLRHSRSLNVNAPNFLNKSDPTFKSFYAVLDNEFKTLRKEGIGCEIKHTEIITKEEESKLWILVFLICLLLKVSCVLYFITMEKISVYEEQNTAISNCQFTRFSDHYLYTENGSKNLHGGLRQLKIENKRVPICDAV